MDETTRLRRLLASKSELTIGIDEVGLGAWAGPMVMAAVILPSDWEHDGVKDSKRFTTGKTKTAHEKRVEVCRDVIHPAAVFMASVGVTPDKIDEWGVDNAWMEMVTRLYRRCQAVAPDAVVVVDGNNDLKEKLGTDMCMSIPKADGMVPAVSAASIVAKSARDTTMVQAGLTYPQYGFERHMGYGTKEHREALDRVGPCPLHRFSYRPIKEYEQKWLSRHQKKEMPDSTS